MMFTLIDYQAKAAAEIIEEVRIASIRYKKSKRLTAIGLTAPTSAGKTVIATAVLESLFFGDAAGDVNPDLTVFWLTDDPALNRQTLNKMILASSRFTDDHLVIVDNQFDERVFAPGKVYFCHIQQLGKGATSYHATMPDKDGNLVTNDQRSFGLWDTIACTVEQRGADFLVVRDEAHIGTGNGREAKQTIVTTVVHGGQTPIGTHQPPAPIVFGISATSERFFESMKAPKDETAQRNVIPIGVDPEEVRASGMLKDNILLKHPGEAQVAEDTLLVQAIVDLKTSDAAWRTHHEITGDSLVKPILVLQVPPAVPNTKIDAILDTLQSTWGILSDLAVAHSFGEHAPLTIGKREVRYIAPDAISDDDTVRVVLFKDALTTGWDCPRAEVMLSLRVAADYTNIAQLIGRMVRTPLACRIETDESLNDVSMYLPYFEPKNVERVIRALEGDVGSSPSIKVNPVGCPPNPTIDKALFDLLASMPSYIRPKRVYSSNVARLIALAGLLADHGLVQKPTETVRTRIVGTMRTEDESHSEEVDRQMKDNLELLMTQQTIAAGTFMVEADENAEPNRRRVTSRDLKEAFARAKRVFPDATADWYYDDLCENQAYDDDDAFARVAAMSVLSGVVNAVEAASATQIDAWRQSHKASVERQFSSAIRAEFTALWDPTKGGLVPVSLEVPESVNAATERVEGETLVPLETLPKHLFCLPNGHKNFGRFPVKHRSSWEREVLESELDFGTLVGWYRNPSNGKNALSVSYQHGDEEGLLHPDFLFFHEIDGDGLVLDVVDPHMHSSADTGPKWAGLARWAATKPQGVRRVVAVIKVGEVLRSLDLRREGLTEQLEKAATKPEIEALFGEFGENY